MTNLTVFEDSTIQEFLRQIAPVRSELDRLILFGSRARGDSKPSSDYDILVVMPEKDRQVIDALYDVTMASSLRDPPPDLAEDLPEGRFRQIRRNAYSFHAQCPSRRSSDWIRHPKKSSARYWRRRVRN